MEDEGGGYRWETGYEKTWEAITEDGDGLLEVCYPQGEEKKAGGETGSE